MAPVHASDLPPFHNEPFTDFSRPAQAEAFRAALARVRSQLGRSYPNAAGTRRFQLPATQSSTNPARPSEVIGVFPASGAAQADEALAAAEAAFPAWSARPWEERAAVLLRLASLLRRQKHDWSAWLVLEVGKTWAEADGDTAEAIDFCEWYAREALRYARGVDVVQTGDHNECFYVPLGPGVAIAPWNFPLMLETWKIAPALAWGNTVVLKPAEDTPTSATIMARLALEAGFPPGVLNVVHGFGPDSAGQALTENPDVDRITFTGESGTGRIIGRAAMANLTPVSLELGGKGANIIFDDAELDNAVNWAIQAIFRNAGQVCLAGSRLFVQRGIYDKFMDRYVAAAEKLKIGDPSKPDTEFGSLASEEHYTKVCRYIDLVESEGGKIATGGRGEGWVVKPTIVTGLTDTSKLVCEEIFGPVVAVLPFDTESEVIARANDNRYGLNAMVFTENLNRAHRVAGKLSAGTVWVNCFFIRDLRAPFGGVGDSGIGREGGNFSREFFTEPKAVVMQINRESPD